MERTTQSPAPTNNFLNAPSGGNSFAPPTFQLKASGAPIQAYSKTRADDGGNHIGNPAACHCHIDIGKPHFKYGKDKGSRINFGNDMSLQRMQIAYNTLLSEYEGKDGYDDCKDYLEDMGCVEQEGEDKLDMLKDLLVMWGGLSDRQIFYYDSDGQMVFHEIYSPEHLDGVLEDYESEILKSGENYSEWSEGGGDLFTTKKNRDIEWDEIHAQQNEEYSKKRSFK